MDKSPHEVSITKISIKKENINNDIKEFAETAMNELLGWYGYSPKDDCRNLSRTCGSYSESNSSSPESPKFAVAEICGWCGKPVEKNTSLCSATAVFCSEMCFSQSRRANFKKSKTCDWCKHVRHTVSYVDFQDGASQLQFCSDKCLNQYKMHIFCRETRAHLELHPHFTSENPSSGTLITPDLWMKNCKTPDSRSPSPRISTPPSVEETKSQTSPLPLISIAHPSRLMPVSPSSPETRRIRKQPKKCRKRCPSTITGPIRNADSRNSNDLPQDLRVKPTTAEHPRSIFDGSIRDGVLKEPIQEPADFPSQIRPPEPPLLNPNYFASHPMASLRRPLDLIPPPTILVPYPLILPLPIPIPIPLPIFKRTNCKDGASEVHESKEAATQTDLEETERLPSHHDDIDVVSVEDTNPGNARPLRKRKRVVDKPKLVVKSKMNSK